MISITLQIHAVAEQLPDDDTDVLIFDRVDEEGQLGAYVGHTASGVPMWVDAQGERVGGVTHWAEMPRLYLPVPAKCMEGGCHYYMQTRPSSCCCSKAA